MMRPEPVHEAGAEPVCRHDNAPGVCLDGAHDPGFTSHGRTIVEVMHELAAWSDSREPGVDGGPQVGGEGRGVNQATLDLAEVPLGDADQAGQRVLTKLEGLAFRLDLLM